jgi:hypothetical protein
MAEAACPDLLDEVRSHYAQVDSRVSGEQDLPAGKGASF